MLDTHNKKIRELIFCGNFGLEKESLRVTGEGFFSHTPHPFPKDDHIVRDFCENQIEINTGISDSAKNAVQELKLHTQRVEKIIKKNDEYLWRFSNPPYIIDENDIPIAEFSGENEYKTEYRRHLAQVYGRYKMTLSGIHVNYSFSDELILAGFTLSGEKDIRVYKDNLYLKAAKGLALYGWIITLLLSASPLSDSSYIYKGKIGEDMFLGMSSLRCSESGYWNYFVPVLSYKDAGSYADSIQKYVDTGLIKSQTELYYPIRLKSKGVNSLYSLVKEGINHIEIRNIDLNPFVYEGIDVRDLEFIRLLIIYLLLLHDTEISDVMQIRASASFKNAAHYDIETSKVFLPDGTSKSAAAAALAVLVDMKNLLCPINASADDVLQFQIEKIKSPEKRYAVRVMEKFSGGYVKNGMRTAMQMTENPYK